LKFANDKNLAPSIRSSALTVVGATGKGDPRAYPLIFDQFKRAADANDFQSMANSLVGIAKTYRGQGQTFL